MIDKVILRPLITWDKPDIISEARRIGTLEFAETLGVGSTKTKQVRMIPID